MKVFNIKIYPTMKRIITLYAILLATVTIVQAQGPQLTVENKVYNFGTIKEEAGSVSYSFKFTNTGDAPLIISRVSSSCGCTASEWPKEPLAPGASSSITVTYNPVNRPGAFNQSITIYSNVGKAGTVLVIRGQVEPRPQTPADIYKRKIGEVGLNNSHLSFGNVDHNGEATGSLEMYNFGNEPATITFKNIADHLTVTTEPTVIAPNAKGEIKVVFNAKKADDWGFVMNRVTMLVNGESPQGNLISISANIQENFSTLNEAELEKAAAITFNEIVYDFGAVEEGFMVKHDFNFTNTGKSDLIIRKVKASCGCTTIAPSKLVIKPGESSSINASFRTNGYVGRQSKTVTVITNDPKQSSMVLRLTGTVNKK